MSAKSGTFETQPQQQDHELCCARLATLNTLDAEETTPQITDRVLLPHICNRHDLSCNMSGQQVLAAINALYTSDDSSTRNEADRWLDNWQASPEAWTVANQILHDPSSGAEYTYFCAQTLKTKVCYGSTAFTYSLCDKAGRHDCHKPSCCIACPQLQSVQSCHRRKEQHGSQSL